MRIGMISPLEMRVPPHGYGGTELVVSLLTEELVGRGHDVTLFASGDSETSATLSAGCERFLRGSDHRKDVLTLLHVAKCFEQAEDFDIIHNHTLLEGMALAGLVETPVLTTLHGGLEGDWLELFRHYRGWYNTISHSARSLLPDKKRFAGVIYNAIDCKSYPFNQNARDNYLLYLSRISPEKGAHLAIEIAALANRRLIIAGNIDRVDRDYFEQKVRPHVDGERIHYVGEADSAMKRRLLSEARCLIAPITWNEPFGLFMAESMACGTPVLVFRRGSAPELIENGVTGFVVDTVDEMAAAVSQVGTIDPQACRQRVEKHFDVPRMADDYLEAYERILERMEISAPRTEAPYNPTLSTAH